MVGSDGDWLIQCACPLQLYSYGQLPVSQLSPSREEVSAEDLVSGRWEQRPWRYAEPTWNGCRREPLLPLRNMDSQRGSGDCWSRRLSQTEHESRDRPWHVMDTNVGGEAAPPPPPFPPFIPHLSPSAELHACLQKAKKEMLESGWFPVEPWPTWNLWFLDASRDIKRGFRDILMGQSKHRDMLGGEKKQKPCLLPEIHMLLSTATKGQAGRQLKTTARNERRHELKGK